MRLFLAEKKVLAEAIASAIDGQQNIKDGVIFKGSDAVTWLSGHLLTLKQPQDYDEKYKSWNLADLPIYFEPWHNAVPSENSARVKQIGELLKKADEVVNCGDTDEEGQLLVDEVLRFFNYKGSCKRLDTANTTVDALKKAMRRMKNNNECVNDGWSAYARQVSDITFGINLTRFYSKKYDAKLPVGRVQTPTLGLVVKRDMAIEGHKKTYYYMLNAQCDVTGHNVMLTYVPIKDLNELTDGKFLSSTFPERLGKAIEGSKRNFTVKKERVKENAPLPFNLTTLNSYCGKKWGYKPDDVMKITQSLRDNYSAITYNRSDCQYLSSEHFAEAPETVRAASQNLGLDESIFDTKIRSRCFNDAYITAHFAIIPTNISVDMSKLSVKEKNVYKAICTFYLIQFMQPCIKEKTTVTSKVLLDGKNIGELRATSSKVVSPGFMAFLKESVQKKSEDDEQEDTEICLLPEGIHEGFVKKSSISKKETKPPKRYTQTTLYEDMTKISKYVDDPKIKDLLLEKDKEKKGENGSIGTSATRAEIIKKLISSGFLEEKKEGKSDILVSTSKGRKFYNLLPDNIKKADTTALWWVVQEDIKSGKVDYTALTRNVLDTVKTVIENFKDEDADISEFASFSGGTAICKCPNCGSDILKGKFGPYCRKKCGFRLGRVFGQNISEKQFISLCRGNRIKISGIPKKSGDGTFDAFAVPNGIESFSYDSNGKHYEGKQLKIEMVFK